MIPSPESRAREVCVRITRFADWRDREAVIASAIREAENAKLEQAAELALEGHDEAWGHPAEQHGWEQAAQRIRSLKHKD